MPPAFIERPSTAPGNREGSLAAPVGRRGSKGGFSSAATSNASSDNLGDGSHGTDLRSSGDGAMDHFRSRGSDDGHSEASSHRRRMSKLFKKGRLRRKSAASAAPTTQEDVRQPDAAPAEDIPPLPVSRPQLGDMSLESQESIGLHKSVPSSLLADDSDHES